MALLETGTRQRSLRKPVNLLPVRRHDRAKDHVRRQELEGRLVGNAVETGALEDAFVQLIGAGTGALIGSAATPQPAGQCARWGYDYNGNRICVAYY